VYLARSNDEYGTAVDFIFYKVDFMDALSFFYGQDEIEVVPVKIMHKVPIFKHCT
jgi:hypothetical protein